MSTRLLWSLVVTVTLAGCADPPGVTKPKPMNYQEEAKATEIYNRYAPKLKEVDGVVTTYLTATNNPRRIMVVVEDRKARSAVREKFGSDLEGLKMKIKISDQEVPDDSAGIEEVPTEGLAAGTIWGKVLNFFTSVKANFNQTVFGQQKQK